MTSLNDFENLTKQIDKQFEGVNKRLDRIDSHLEKLDGRLWTAFFTLTVMILGVQPERFDQNPLGVLVTKQSEVGNSQEEDGPVICGVEGERALDVFPRRPGIKRTNVAQVRQGIRQLQ